ncbi:ciliogenesis-associated TTC17-interacting protein, partial [Asbolus verrucosus]
MEERKSTGGSAEDKHVSQTENSGEKFPSVGTEENLSLGGVTPGHSFELKEIYPADEESETRDHSLVEICPMFSQAAEECGSSLRKGPPPLESVESAESATSAVRHILREIVGKAVVDKAPKKRKKPVMKSGWMTLREVIPDFDIDDSMFKEMLFRETLLVSTFEENSSYPTPVGALSLDIQSAKGGPLTNVKKTRSDYVYPKFLVHLSSQFNFYGHNGGSRIMAWVDRDLQTLEEIRKEFVQLENNEFDWQSLYVNAQDTFYYMRHNKKDDKFSSPERAKNLICEGANFILMRYLAMKRFIGTFEVSTVYINGDLCRNVY